MNTVTDIKLVAITPLPILIWLTLVVKKLRLLKRKCQA